MKVMLVVNEFPPEKIAGTAMATQALAEHLTLRGHKVCVVVTTSCPKEVKHQITPHDYVLIWLKARPFRGLGWVWKIGQAFKLAKLFKPDIIQGQAVSCGLIAALVGRWICVPSICYAQGYDVYQATWLQKKTEIRWGCAWSTQVLAVTADLAANIQHVVSLPPITIMPHAFERPEIKCSREVLRQQYGLLVNDSLVLSVGRLEIFKGHDVLLRAWPACLTVNPNAKLWIAGSGSQHGALQSIVHDLDIQSSVKFVGYLSKGEVHQMMESSDLFVLPSRSEPFGIVLLEAMVHGLPVVASNVGGVPEVVPDNKDVKLVPAGDIEMLSQAMQEYIQQPYVPAIKNSQHAIEFEWGKHVERFEVLYQKLLSEA